MEPISPTRHTSRRLHRAPALGSELTTPRRAASPSPPATPGISPSSLVAVREEDILSSLRGRWLTSVGGLTRGEQEEDERTVKGRPKPTPVNAPVEVVFDPSASGARKPRRPGAPSASNEWHSFMGSSLSDMYWKPVLKKSADTSDDEPDIDIGKLLKDVELFGASTFKERKQIENRKVVKLGGKAVKKHCTPLSVAKPALKNQKKRELKKIEEEKLIGIFRKRDKNSKAQKTRPENRVLRATEGHFKNGILDVKHLLSAPKPSGRNAPEPKMRKGKHKGKGKQKGGRRKRR